MSTKIIPKKSTVSGKIPSATDLESGEVAINLTDAIFYVKHTDGSIVNLSGAPELHTHTISQIDNLQTELDSKADKDSPNLTGNPTAPTADTGTNTTQIATTAYVQGEISNLGSESVESVSGTTPITIDNTDTTNPIVGVDTVTTTSNGAMLSTDKTKLDGIETGAQVNTVDSINSKTGVVSLSTTDISEGANLYFTDARAQDAISVSGDLSYSLGVISFSETYSTPNELLSAIITVDGSGSGLDADTLDGKQSYEFANIALSQTPPTSPSNEDLWVDSEELVLYIYYNDGMSSQWVSVSGPKGADGVDGEDGLDGVQTDQEVAKIAKKQAIIFG